jgi:hypothetical protein
MAQRFLPTHFGAHHHVLNRLFFFWFFFRNEGWLPASPKIGIILIFGVSSSQFITLNKKKRETQNQEKEKKIKLFLFSCDKTEI